MFNNTNWKKYGSNSSTKASTRTLTAPSSSSTTNDPCQQAMQDEWWFSFFDDSAEYDISLSGKLTFLKTLLEECEQIGDKVLLFSRSLYSLSYMEQYLKYWDSIASGKKVQADDFDAKVKPNGRWKFGIDYFRIDGSYLILLIICIIILVFYFILKVALILLLELVIYRSLMIQLIFDHVFLLFQQWLVVLVLI